MSMHLNTKKIAFAGVMLALTEVGIALGSVIETNTLFLLAAASFFVGIVIQEFGLKSGAGFLLAGILLAILLSPNKLYVVSYAFMGFYILIIETIWHFSGSIACTPSANAIDSTLSSFASAKLSMYQPRRFPVFCFFNFS